MSRTKKAIIQCADTSPLESLVYMLRTAGYTCLRVGTDLAQYLQTIGLDTVMTNEYLVNSMGYQPVKMIDGIATKQDLKDCDLFVDIKGHRNYLPLVNHHPRLEKRILWYRINGGEPEHVINQNGDMGNEISPPCPVITPNRWYASDELECKVCGGDGTVPMGDEDQDQCLTCGGWGSVKAPWFNTPRYAFWPSFHRPEFNATMRANPQVFQQSYLAPICLLHNFTGWGYASLQLGLKRLGVRLYGRGSPDGLINNEVLPVFLRHALCMVHAKSNDAPGYALYEAIHSGCPVIVSRRLIWRCRMEALYQQGQTCLVFDRETHSALTLEDTATCLGEIEYALDYLRDPVRNMRISANAYDQLNLLKWHPDRNAESLKAFLTYNFGD